VRRGVVILLVCAALLACGGLSLVFVPRVHLENVEHVRLDLLVCVTCFFLSALAGIVGMACLRRSCRRLAARVEELTMSGKSGLLESGHPDLAKLTFAINGLTEQARAAVDRAMLQVKELEIQLKVATAEREHAQAIIYSISDAVLVTDPFDDLVLANESAARTFNFDIDKAKSSRTPVARVLNDPKLIDLIQEMRQSNSRSGRRIVEHQVQTPAGGRTFKVTLSCVADAKAPGPRGQGPSGPTGPTGPTGVVAVLHDMTKEKEVAEMKNDFVSSVSHELRTPLASIKAYVEMLIDGEADDDKTKREFYEVIQNEANRLSRLIDNILNISRIESGLVKINKQPQSLTVIIKEALEVIAPQAAQRNITLKEQLTPVFYQTFADRDMLYQAVLNLLSNAVKYTPEGGSICVQTQVDEAKRIVITRITDTGTGIPPKDLPFVFDKFFRSDANSRMAKGTGLGLSLVKQIIEGVHKGRIFVESQLGRGSCFGFELRLTE
jgi:two-component system phosphate regulon sensor histidine kinase PhoR